MVRFGELFSLEGCMASPDQEQGEDRDRSEPRRLARDGADGANGDTDDVADLGYDGLEHDGLRLGTRWRGGTLRRHQQATGTGDRERTRVLLIDMGAQSAFSNDVRSSFVRSRGQALG